jgi:hypothetical protein
MNVNIYFRSSNERTYSRAKYDSLPSQSHTSYPYYIFHIPAFDTLKSDQNGIQSRGSLCRCISRSEHCISIRTYNKHDVTQRSPSQIRSCRHRWRGCRSHSCQGKLVVWSFFFSMKLQLTSSFALYFHISFFSSLLLLGR